MSVMCQEMQLRSVGSTTGSCEMNMGAQDDRIRE